MVFTEWLLAILYLIGGMNDLFMDLVYYCRPLRRWIAQGRENPVAHPGDGAGCAGGIAGQAAVLGLQTHDPIHNPSSAVVWGW